MGNEGVDYKVIDETVTGEDLKSSADIEGYDRHEFHVVFEEKEESFHSHPLLTGSKSFITEKIVEHNLIKEHFHESGASIARKIWEKGTAALLEEIAQVTNDPNTRHYINVSRRLKEIERQELLDSKIKDLQGKIGRYLSQEEFEQFCYDAGRNPAEFQDSINLTEVSASKEIRDWLIENVTSIRPSGEIRTMMVSHGIIESGNSNQWKLCKNVASRLGMTSGEYGKWSPPKVKS